MEHIIKTAVNTVIQDAKAARPAPTEKDKDLAAMLGEHRTRIRVVGCGGGGNNTVTRLMEVGITAVETLAINTDAQDLLYATANDKLLIGRTITSGLGAGSDPKIGEDSALENKNDIEAALQKTDMVFVTCGLGGGTGTGSAPVVAEVARKLGALTISIVTLPFTEEGIMRWDNARLGLEKLSQNSDTVIVVQNDRLLEIVPDMPLDQAFKVADEILVNAVKGITELVTEKGLVNLDFADVRSVMRNGGTAMIGLGESEGADHAKHAVEMAIQNPLLDVDIIGAKSALINITGGAEMSLKDAKIVMRTIAEKLDPAARVIWGARVDQKIKGTIRVMLIVTGLRNQGRGISDIARAIEKNSTLRDSAPSSGRAHAPSAVMPLPTLKVEAGRDGAKTGDNSKSVFSKIFEEEAQSDLEMLRQAIADLSDDLSNKDTLRGIKNAALAINNSAQLFAFNRIADFAGVVEEVSSRALAGEIQVSEKLAKLYDEVPDIVVRMITGDQDALAYAEIVAEKFRRLHDRRDDDNSDFKKRADDDGYTRPEIAEPRLQSVSPSLDEQASKTGAHDGAKLTRVGDAVEYVRNLFGGESGKKR